MKAFTKLCIVSPWPLPSPLYLVSHFILAFPEGGLIADSVRQNLLSVVLSHTLSIYFLCVALHPFLVFCVSAFAKCCTILFPNQFLCHLLPQHFLHTITIANVFLWAFQLNFQLEIVSDFKHRLKKHRRLTHHWACFTKGQFFFSAYPVHSECLISGDITLISKILGAEGDSYRLFLRLLLQNLERHRAFESWTPVRLPEHCIRFANKRNVLLCKPREATIPQWWKSPNRKNNLRFQ